MASPQFQFLFEYDVPVPEDTEALLTRVAECCLRAEGVSLPCAASLRFTDDAEIHKINREWRQVDRSTDVLSFPAAPLNPGRTAGRASKLLQREWDTELAACMLGDIVISVEKVREQAEAYGHSEKRELAFLVAHSMLHLFGYDHMEDEERKIMEAKQEEILKLKGYIR